ncbi:hypothetical protein Aduo_003939 [Ancylostoma duodenale]
MDSGSLVEEVKGQSMEAGNKTKPSPDLGGPTEEKKIQTSPPTKPELPQNQQAKSQSEAERLEHGGGGYEDFGPSPENVPEAQPPAAATEAAATRTPQPIAPVMERTKHSDKSRQRRRSTMERLFPEKTQELSGRGHMAKALRTTKRSEVAV